MSKGLGLVLLFLLLGGLFVGGLYYWFQAGLSIAQFSLGLKWQVGGEEVQNSFVQMVAPIGAVILFGSLVIGIGFLLLAVGSFVAFAIFFIFCLIGIILVGVTIPYLTPLFIPIIIGMLLLLIKKKKSQAPSK